MNGLFVSCVNAVMKVKIKGNIWTENRVCDENNNQANVQRGKQLGIEEREKVANKLSNKKWFGLKKDWSNAKFR